MALQKSISKPWYSPLSATKPKPGTLALTPHRSSPRSLMALTRLCENALLATAAIATNRTAWMVLFMNTPSWERTCLQVDSLSMEVEGGLHRAYLFLTLAVKEENHHEARASRQAPVTRNEAAPDRSFWSGAATPISRWAGNALPASCEARLSQASAGALPCLWSFDSSFALMRLRVVTSSRARWSRTLRICLIS